jgi:hypothetical protein
MRHKHMPRLDIPRAPSRPGSPISQHHRLTLLRRFLTDDQIELRTRVAASLVLLWAQPVSRLVRLTTADVTSEDGQVWLRLGHPPIPVPGPLDTMLRELAASRANMNTAANPDCDWLFPGGRAGQPLTATALLQQLQPLGIHATQTRTAAFRQLVLQAAAPVVAKALGYQHGTAAKHAAAGGGIWSRNRPPAPGADDRPAHPTGPPCAGSRQFSAPRGRNVLSVRLCFGGTVVLAGRHLPCPGVRGGSAGLAPKRVAGGLTRAERQE